MQCPRWLKYQVNEYVSSVRLSSTLLILLLLLLLFIISIIVFSTPSFCICLTVYFQLLGCTSVINKPFTILLLLLHICEWSLKELHCVGQLASCSLCIVLYSYVASRVPGNIK